MLSSLLLPLMPVSIVDKDLENCINSCIAKLAMHTPPMSETLKETLDQLECGLVQYTKKHQINYFKILNAQQAIKAKKVSFLKLSGDLMRDISGITTILRHYRELYMAGKIPEVESYRCTERVEPLFNFMKSVLNEMIRINAYEDSIKDILKHQLGILHIAIGHFHFCTKNYHAAIFHLHEKMTVADSIVMETLKESLLDVTDVFTLTTAYSELNDLPRVASILRLERERCTLEAPLIYYSACNTLASKYALQNDFPNAIAWYQTAMNVNETLELHRVLNRLLLANINAMVEYLQMINKDAAIMHDPSERRNDHKMIIPVSLPEWSPDVIARVKQLAGKFTFDFAPEQLTVHKLSCVGVTGLARIVDSIKKVEQEYQQKRQKHVSSSIEHSIDDLQSAVAALTISESLVEMSLPNSSSSSSSSSASTFTSCEAGADPKRRTSAKLKTRGKPQIRGRATQKLIAKVLPTCDAERYGFSRALFGMHAFHECRMRGDSNRVFYVVEDKIEASNQRGDNHRKFADLIAEPKIVPPCGEEGFKWMKVEGRQVLVGKVLDTKKRLFPTVAQRNEQGAIAFLYGRVVNTKNRIPEKCVKHYAPVATKPKT